MEVYFPCPLRSSQSDLGTEHKQPSQSGKASSSRCACHLEKEGTSLMGMLRALSRGQRGWLLSGWSTVTSFPSYVNLDDKGHWPCGLKAQNVSCGVRQIWA